jgi:xanthine/CO dehydrogenase XdhC/CoxF family maturation factor
MMIFLSVCPHPASCRREKAYFHAVVHRKRDRDLRLADRAASVQLQQAQVGAFALIKLRSLIIQ